MRYVDVRGTRFGGALTAILSVVAIAMGHPVPYALLALVLLVGAFAGPRYNLWGILYRVTLARRLAKPTGAQREPEAPPRFANLLGGVFLLGAALSAALGVPWLALGLTAIVVALATLNATTGFCVGCRFYGLLVLRGAASRAAAAVPEEAGR